MTVYEVMSDQVFNADERHKDTRLSELVDIEWAINIYEEQQY
jgi:hypothetical protein